MAAGASSSSFDYAVAVAFLRERKTRGVSLGLGRMRRFLDALGHPEETVPCLHIAGTNGKGSVAAMIEAILREAGWRTGLYTSPHLVRLGERIQVERRPLTEAEIASAVGEMRTVVAAIEVAEGEEEGPSYFEFMTGLALRHFAQVRCDISCLEVGLGGRLDATNVVTPLVSVITSIGLDHCDLLGNTLGEIAAEKAGIIKPGVPVVIGRLPPEAETVVREIAEARDATVWSVREEFGEAIAGYPETNLAGDYQRWNAATATLAARILPSRWNTDPETVERALQAVEWAGRWQSFQVGGRRVIVDTSHNAEGAGVLAANLRRLEEVTGRRPIIVGGVLGLARARPLVEVFCAHANEVHFVVPGQRRACRWEELEALVPAGFAGRVVRDELARLFPAPDVCAAGEPDDVVVVAGSVFLAGEVLARLEPARGPHEGELQDF